MTREEAIEILIAVAVCDRPILSCDFCARYVGMGTDCTYPSDKEIEEAVLLLKGASNDAAISAIRQRDVTDTNVGKWISVKDRLPEAGGYVVCIAKRNPFSRFMPMVARIEKNGWANPITEQYISEVTHWMPLPELPKGE